MYHTVYRIAWSPSKLNWMHLFCIDRHRHCCGISTPPCLVPWAHLCSSYQSDCISSHVFVLSWSRPSSSSCYTRYCRTKNFVSSSTCSRWWMWLSLVRANAYGTIAWNQWFAHFSQWLVLDISFWMWRLRCSCCWSLAPIIQAVWQWFVCIELQRRSKMFRCTSAIWRRRVALRGSWKCIGNGGKWTNTITDARCYMNNYNCSLQIQQRWKFEARWWRTPALYSCFGRAAE